MGIYLALLAVVAGPIRCHATTITVASFSHYPEQQKVDDYIQASGLGATIKTISFPRPEPSKTQSAVVTSLFSLLASSDPPDVIELPVGQADLLYDAGLIISGTSLVKTQPSMRARVDRMFASVRDASEWRGVLVGIPRSEGVDMMYYNRTRVADAGLFVASSWDWNDLLQIAQKIVSLPGSTGSVVSEHKTIKLPVAVAICPPASCWLPFVRSNGGEYVDPSRSKWLFNSPESSEAMNWLLSATRDGLAAYMSGGAAITGFRQGWVTFIGESTFNDRVFRQPGSDAVGILPFPRSPHTQNSITDITPFVYVVNKHSAHIDLDIAFIEAALSDKAMAFYALQHDLPPFGVTLSTLYPQEASVLVPSIENAVGYPPLLKNGSVYTPFSQQADRLFDNQVSLDNFIAIVGRHVAAELGDQR